MSLSKTTQNLMKVRKQIQDLDKEYEKNVTPLKALKEGLQQEIQTSMQKMGEYSVRFAFGSVVRAVRKSLQITNEEELVHYLKAENLTDYISERPNQLFDGLKNQALKEGREMPGTEVVETEYLSIRENDSDIEKRKIHIE